MSEDDLYYLNPTTAVEPLIHRWVAWSHIIAPIPACLHLKNYQVLLLRSFLEDPRAHWEACQDRELRSGPFVEIDPGRAAEVETLLEEIERDRSFELETARDLFEFHGLLVAEARGQCLEPYYCRVPETLRGYVELVYDYYNRPTVRLFEGMTYKGPWFDSGRQSLRIGSQVRDNSRSFFMNTPRLVDSEHLDVPMPFSSPALDELFRLDQVPQRLSRIRELLCVGDSQIGLLRNLLVRDAPFPPEPWRGREVRIRYIGHACALIEWQGVSMLTDACVGCIPLEGASDRFTYRDLPSHIDFALVTHNHQDHFWPETLLRLRHRIGSLVVPRSGIFYGDMSLRWVARSMGFNNVIELEPFEAIPLPDGEIIGIPFMGEHADLAHGKIAYVIRAGHQRMIFGADSDCLEPRVYENIRDSIGPIDTVFLGMECVGAPLTWDCGPFLPIKVEHEHDQTRRYKGSDSRRALEICEAVDARRIFLYALGLEPWYEHILGLAYNEDSMQLSESRRLLGAAPQRNLEARLMFNKCELLLDASTPRVPRVAGGSPKSAFPEASAVFDDGGDEFTFD